ncbi:MAG: hypothetical protein V4721_16530 [Bacteroidota bacterium]
MSATTIERKIAKNMNVDQPDLFSLAIGVESYALFSLQFFCTGQAGGVNGVITLMVSNDGVTFKAVPTKSVTLDILGTNTYYIFIGTSEGISAVTHVKASYVKNAINAGTIEKVILMGNLGNQ